MKKRKSKFIGLIFDGRWEVVERTVVPNGHGKFRLVNIYNQNEMIIHDTIMADLASGKTTISRIIAHDMKKNHAPGYKTTYKY